MSEPTSGPSQGVADLDHVRREPLDGEAGLADLCCLVLRRRGRLSGSLLRRTCDLSRARRHTLLLMSSWRALYPARCEITTGRHSAVRR